MLLKPLKRARMSRRLRSLTRSMLARLPREDSRRPSHKANVEGYCVSCRKVTANQLLVVGHFMKARRCEECGRVERASPLVMAECYSDEFVDRLGDLVKRAKPSKLRSLRAHLRGIPARVVRKALREAAYVSDLLLRQEEWPKNG